MAAQTEKLTGDFHQQIEEVYQLIYDDISKKYGASEAKLYADDWLTYARENRSKGTVSQLYLAWLLTQSNLPQNLGSAIITGIKTAGGTDQALTQALPALSPTGLIGGIWGTLTDSHLWIRVGEFVVALILLDVGLKAFTNKSVIETVAKKTPAGKAGHSKHSTRQIQPQVLSILR
jgi:hypothetical protein